MNIIKKIYYDALRVHELKGSDKFPSKYELLLISFSIRQWPVNLYRVSNLLYSIRLYFFSRIFSFLNFLIFNIEIAPQCEIGIGLFLPHTTGTVIGAVKIGDNATIYQSVTIGARSLDFGYEASVRPSIGDNVTLGSGCKIIGGVKIGDNVRVGPNAVVVRNVVSNSLILTPESICFNV